MTTLLAPLRTLLASGDPAVLVRVSRALGSTPREAGARMIVTRETSLGTVGGGALELAAIGRAREMLLAGDVEVSLAIPLGPAIGQCCGGHVTLVLARATEALVDAEQAAEAARLDQRPAVLIFGAGHTGRALARAMAPLPLNVRMIDTRPDSLLDLPAEIAAAAAALPEAEVAAARPGTAFLVMTHDHGLDFLIAAAALERRDAAYVGMIGSATKREKFRRHLSASGRSALIAGLTLPIGRPAGGLSVRDKRPEVIAALTAAEVTAVLLSKLEENQALPLAGAGSQCNSDGAGPGLPSVGPRSPKVPHVRAS